jgi:hypothetical protein
MATGWRMMRLCGCHRLLAERRCIVLDEREKYAWGKFRARTLAAPIVYRLINNPAAELDCLQETVNAMSPIRSLS